MTSLLQPLDVAVNRSFQSYYNQKYSEYVDGLAVGGSTSVDKHVGLKVPNYELVSKWVLEWKRDYVSNKDRNPFDICGLVDPTEYDQAKLHEPLMALIKNEQSVAAWESQFEEEIFDMKDLFDFNENDYFLPEENNHSFYNALSHLFPGKLEFLKEVPDKDIDDNDVQRVGQEVDVAIKLVCLTDELYVKKVIFCNCDPVPEQEIEIVNLANYYFVKLAAK